MRRTLFLSVMILFIFCSEVNAQNSAAQKHFKTAGFLIGWGNSMMKGTGYQVYYNIGDYSESFKVPKKKDFMAWYAEPQFNFVTGDSTKKREC